MTRLIRSKRNRCFVAILSISLAGSVSLMAQAVYCPSGSSSTRCSGFQVAAGGNVVKGEPYTAQATTELQQTTANGTHISQTSTATLARDSEGRTMRTETLRGIGPLIAALPNDSVQVINRVPAGSSEPDSTSQAGKTTLTTVFDPVAGTHIDYTSDSKVAHVFSVPEPGSAAGLFHVEAGAMPPLATVTMPAGPAVADGAVIAKAFQGSPDAPADAKTDSLGIRTIDGVTATGTRSTQTIPAGSIGNDKDIVITQETWYSPDLQMVLQSIHNDARYGQTTYTITNLERGEPDASLFQVPPGYTIDKLKPQISKAVIGSGME